MFNLDLENRVRVFDFESTYNFLLEDVGVSEEALDLAFSLNGENYQTASDILFYYTGWHDFDAYIKDMQEM